MAPPTKPRWRFHVKPHPAPRRAGPLACNKRVGVQLFLASARAKQLGASSNATPKNRCGGLSAPLAYAHARGVRAKTPPLASARSTTPVVRRAPWEATTLIRHRSSGQAVAVATADQSCGGLFLIASAAPASARERPVSGRHPRHCAKTAPRSKAHTYRELSVGKERSTACPEFANVPS